MGDAADVSEEATREGGETLAALGNSHRVDGPEGVDGPAGNPAAAGADGAAGAEESTKKKKRKKRKKPKSKVLEDEAVDMSLDAPQDLSPSAQYQELEEKQQDIVLIFAKAQACVESRDLDEALEQHYAVIRAADLLLEPFKDSEENQSAQTEVASQFTEYERTTKLPQCLNDVHSRRRVSMGEAVNLLAHMEKYEHVPPLCSQLLERPESEQDEIRWLFHRGRAYVKQWEPQYQQRQDGMPGGVMQEPVTREPNSLIRLGLRDFDRALDLCPDTVQFIQWRAWARWLMRDYEICAQDCDRGLEFSPRSIPLLRLRGDALVELRFFRKALHDYDMIAQLYTESNEEQQSQRDLQDLLRRKHDVANQFLQQADDMTGLLLSQIDSKTGTNRPESSSSQEEQMGLFHGMLLQEGKFTGVVHVGSGITSCKLEDEHKEMLDGALTCMSRHQFKEALEKVKVLRGLENEMLRGPLMCFDAELKMSTVQFAMHTENTVQLEDITPILDYAICIFRESAEAQYHRQALWILATVFIKRGRLRTAVRVLDELIGSHPQYRHSYCQKVELLKADGCSIEEVAEVVKRLEALQQSSSITKSSGSSSSSSDGFESSAGGGNNSEETKPLLADKDAADEESETALAKAEAEDEAEDDDTVTSTDAAMASKAALEAQVLLENAKRSLSTMQQDASASVTQRVREAIQSRIQLIQTEEVSRPVLVSLAAVVAYTHAQRFKQAQDMIGKTIKQNPGIAEVFVVRAHVRYTEGSNCEGENATRCWMVAVQDCENALRLNNECWPALWWKAQSLAHLSDPRSGHRHAREALDAMRSLLQFQPSFRAAQEFSTDYDTLERKVMLADANQCIHSQEFDRALQIVGRLLDSSPNNIEALGLKATALGEMLRSNALRYELIFRDALSAELSIIRATPESSREHIDALARRSGTTIEYLKRAGLDVRNEPKKVQNIFRDLNLALKQEPRHRQSLLLRAKVNEMLGNTAEAIDDCTRMLESVAVERKSGGGGGGSNDPRPKIEALAMRASALMSENKYREAMADYDFALQACNVADHSDAFFAEKMAYLQEEKEKAKGALQAEVDKAQNSLLQELMKDELSEATAAAKNAAKRAKKQRQRDKKEREEKLEREKEEQEKEKDTDQATSGRVKAEGHAQEQRKHDKEAIRAEGQKVLTPEAHVHSSATQVADSSVFETIVEVVQQQPNSLPAAASTAGKGKGRGNRSKKSKKGGQGAAAKPAAPQILSVTDSEKSAAREQLASMFGDLPLSEVEAVLSHTGYDVESAVNQIFSRAELAEQQEAEGVLLIEPEQPLEEANDWEEVKSSSQRSMTVNSEPKSGSGGSARSAIERCVQTLRDSGLDLKRSDLDDACWERLLELDEEMLLLSARNYRGRANAASNRGGPGVSNKSALMMSIVHKLSSRPAAAADKQSTPASPKRGKKSSVPSSKKPKEAREPAADAVETPVELQPSTNGQKKGGGSVPPVHALAPPPALEETVGLAPDPAIDKVGLPIVAAAPLDEKEPCDEVQEAVTMLPVLDDGEILFGAPEEEERTAAADEDEEDTIEFGFGAEPEPEPEPDPETERWIRHVARIRQPGTPVGELEIRALAELLHCRIALYSRQVYDCTGRPGDDPSEIAALEQLRECLPHMPSAYLRKVLIQCNMNKDAAVERLMISGADEAAAEDMAKAEADAAEYVHQVTHSPAEVGQNGDLRMVAVVWRPSPTGKGCADAPPQCALLRGVGDAGNKTLSRVLHGSQKGLKVEPVCGDGEPESEGLFTAVARANDGGLGKIAVDMLGRAVRGQVDELRLREGGTHLRLRCADYLDAHRERFIEEFKALEGIK